MVRLVFVSLSMLLALAQDQREDYLRSLEELESLGSNSVSQYKQKREKLDQLIWEQSCDKKQRCSTWRQYFSKKACRCVSKPQCNKTCSRNKALHPHFMCKCVPETELVKLEEEWRCQPQ